MTAHSISISSELKMSFFGPYAGVKTRRPSLRYQLHSVEAYAKCPFLNVVSRDTRCWTRQ